MRSFVITGVLVSATVAAAQVTVTGKDGTSVKVGAGRVEVKTGDSSVSVTGGSSTVEVRDEDADEAAARTTADAPANAGLGPASGFVNGVWQVRGMSKSERHACGPNEDVDIAGQSNALTFTGPCRSVKVSGQSNTVTLEQVSTLKVSGMSNVVTWTRGPGGAAPKVQVSGMGNSASRAK